MPDIIPTAAAGRCPHPRCGGPPTRILLIAVIALMPGWVSAAAASSSTWSGAVDGLWGTAGNWSSGAIPAANTSLTFPQVANQTVDLGDNAGRSISATLTFNSPNPYVFNQASSAFVLGSVNGGTVFTQNGAGSVTINAGINSSGTGRVLNGSGSGVVNLVGAITNTASFVVTGSTYNFMFANPFGGSFTINGGTARASASVTPGSNGAFGSGIGAVALWGGALQVNTATFTRDVSVSGGTIDAYGAARTVGAALNLSGTLTVGATTVASAAGQDLTLSGAITGTGGLTKTGTSLAVISGTGNTYSGGTTINAGILAVTNASGSATGTGAISVASGGTLAGTGTVSGAVTLASGGILSPGASSGGVSGAGTLTCSGGVTMNSGAIAAFDLGTSSDQVVVTGNLTTSGTLNLSGGTGFGAGTYDLFTCTGTLTNGLSVGATPSASYTYGLSTVAGSPNRLRLTVVSAGGAAPTVTARTTQDADGDGKLDAIRITASQALNDDFSSLTVTVSGYTVTGIDTGTTANDAVFVVRLTELASGDTAAVPGVRITVNGSLRDSGGAALLGVDGSAATPSDGAAPVLLTATWSDAGLGGVSADDTIAIGFSEPVVLSGTVWSDVFALPVTSDTLSTTALDTSTASATKTLTLAGSPVLCPGGTFLAAAVSAGGASGWHVPVITQANVVDAVGNAIVGTAAAAALDLGPTLAVISVAWSDGTTTTRPWALSSPALGSSHNTVTEAVSLIVRNTGNQPEKVTVGAAASSPSGWSIAANAGINACEMKVDADGNAAAAPTTVARYELDLSAGTGTASAALTSGGTQQLQLYVRLPTAVTVGGGTAQSLVLTITVQAP